MSASGSKADVVDSYAIELRVTEHRFCIWTKIVILRLNQKKEAILATYFRNRGSIAVEDINLMKG